MNKQELKEQFRKSINTFHYTEYIEGILDLLMYDVECYEMSKSNATSEKSRQFTERVIKHFKESNLTDVKKDWDRILKEKSAPKLTLKERFELNISDILYGIRLLIISLFPTNQKKHDKYIRLKKFTKECVLPEYQNRIGYRLCVYAMDRIINKYEDNTLHTN